MAKKKQPDPFYGCLSEEAEAAFKACNPKQQKFLVHYLVDGCTGSEAYRRSYDAKSATDSVASTRASVLTKADNVSKVIQEYTKKNYADILDAKQALKNGMFANKPVFKEGEMVMEIEDHPTRIKAAVEVLKANDAYVEKSEQTHNYPDGIDVTFTKPSITLPLDES